MKYFLDMYKRYVDFTGRSTRTEFWCAYGIYMVIYIVIYAIAIFAGGVSFANTTIDMSGVSMLGLTMLGLLMIFVLGSFIPLLAMEVRRLRDAGFAWWVLLLCMLGTCVCGIGSIVLLVLLCMPTKEPEVMN